MKKFIKLTALAVLLGAGVCSTAFAKPKKHHMDNKAVVSLIPLRTEKGFAVMVDKLEPGKSMVIVYDNDGYSLYKDVLTKGAKGEKKYLFPDLQDGNYTVEDFPKVMILRRNFLYTLHHKKELCA